MAGFPNIGPTELIVILTIALIVFGPGRLSELGGALGRTVREFRNASQGLSQDEGESSRKSPQERT
ncbi:MAG TPA: twin-arginine translocase TatA/TatE family subunit [Anaerolineae bacterium]|nr:twin-arginine translocase TatA/TatE family subunit [Anaerolineae bacterium]HIQ05204.1 twin-arginine translocase TatA/TatE family subunit [Anaerolineae bacterium]